MSSVGSKVYVRRLAGTQVFDPIGDHVGRVRDLVVLVRSENAPRAVGLVVEVPGKRRVFVPMTRVTSIDPGQVITTGVVNIRRFSQRPAETLVIGDLLDRRVELRDGSGSASIEDVAIERTRTGDWDVARLFVRHSSNKTALGLRRRGETFVVAVDQVTGLAGSGAEQEATLLLAAYEELKPADLAEVLHELGSTRQGQVARALDDDRLADVLEELPEDDQVAIVSSLDAARAADVLEAMQPDDAADLLHELPETQAATLLELMKPEEAKDVRRLLSYAEGTAGGMMTSGPIVLAPEAPVAQALAHARRADLSPALASTVFVVRPPLETPTGHLLGIVHFQRLLREPPHVSLGSVLDDDMETVGADATLGQVTRLLATYNLLALPVVDDERRLLGVVSVDDVLDHMLPEDWRESDHGTRPVPTPYRPTTEVRDG